MLLPAARASRLALALAVGGAGAYVVVACTTTATLTPSGACSSGLQLSLDIASPVGGACVEVPDPKRAVVPVVVQAGYFTIRPPGGCLLVCNCGYIQAYVDGKPATVSGTSLVDIDLSNQPDLYGMHTLTIELVWDINDGGGIDNFDSGAGPNGGLGIYTKSVTVQVAPSCGDSGTPPDAGSDAGPADAGSDAGMADAGPTDGGSEGGTDDGGADGGPMDDGGMDGGDGGDGG